MKGTAITKNAADASINIWGYRYAQHQSYYDTTYPEVDFHTPELILYHNSLWTARVVVKGDARYRVGQRYRLATNTGRPDTSNAVWYAKSVSHHGSYGSDYTTTIDLLYPTVVQTGTTKSGAPPGLLAGEPGALG